MNTLGKLCLTGLLAIATTADAQWENITANVPGAITTGNIGPMDTDGTRLYVLGPVGVWVSSDGGSTFTALNTVNDPEYNLDQDKNGGGVPGPRFIGYAGGKVWVGFDPGSAAANLGFATLHSMTPGASAWDKSGTGFPAGSFNNQADDIAYDASTGTYYAYASGLGGGVFKSTDGVNWSLPDGARLGIGLPASLVALNGVVHAAQPGIGIRRSTDNGMTYDEATVGFISGLNDAGHLVNHNGRLIFPFSNGTLTTENGVLGRRQGILYSDDNGQTWNYSPSVPANSKDAQSDGTTVYFGTTFYSANGGITVDLLDQSGLSGNGIRTVRVGDKLFAFTSTGLFRRDVSTLDLRATTQIAVQPAPPPTLLVGDRHTFKVVAGGENISYQWQRDGSDISGATAPSLTIDPAMASDSGSYTVIVSGDYGSPLSVTSAPVALNVVVPQHGRIDPTFPEMNSRRETALTAVLDDFSVVENDANYVARAIDSGQVGSRNFTDNRFFFQVLDSAGRLLLVDDTSGNEVIRIDPKTLQHDPTFTPFRLDDSYGFTAVAELPGRGYLLGTEQHARLHGRELDAIILIDYQGNYDNVSFDIPNATSGTTRSIVNAIEVTENGDIYVSHSSSFWPTSATTTSGDQGIMLKLKPDGSADTGFTPAYKARMWALRDNRILLFPRIGTPYVPVILHPDGTRDTAFNQAQVGFNRAPLDVVQQFNGKFIVVGDLDTFGANSIGGHIRLHPDGTRDDGYYDTIGYNGSENPTDVSYDPRGFVYFSPSRVSSSTDSFQDSSNRGLVRVFTDRATFGILTHPAPTLADLNGDARLSVAAFGTNLTYQWQKDGVDIPGATNGTLSLANFQAANNGAYRVTVSDGSNTRTSLAAPVRAVSTPVITTQPAGFSGRIGDDAAFTVRFEAASGHTIQWRRNGVNIAGATNATLNLTNVQLIDGGRYSAVITNSFGSVTSADAQLEVRTVTGAYVSAFTPPILNGSLQAVEAMPDGSFLIGGQFSTIGSPGVAHGLFTRVDKNGNLVSGWHEASPGGATGGGPIVRDFEVLKSGKILVAGAFTAMQGNSIANLARLNADGTFDNTFVGAAFNQQVHTVKELPNGKLLVGGSFSSPASQLVLLNADGSHDNTISFNVNSAVEEIIILNDGKIMLCGGFNSILGQSRERIARLNSDLSLDTTFNPPAINGFVYDFDVDSAGGAIIGGAFTQVDGTTINRLARLNPDGSFDPSFTPPNIFFSTVNAVHIQLNGRIVVGGAFTQRLERLNADGTDDPLFNRTITINSTVTDLVTTPDGCIVLVGQFTSPRQYMTIYTTDASDPAVTSSPQNTEVALGGDVTLNVGVFTSVAATYQWFKDGEIIPGATTSSYTISGATKADAGRYVVDVSNANGVASSAPAVVTVLAEPILIRDLPTAYTSVTGGGITLNVGVQGRGPLTYTWTKDGSTTLMSGGRITGAATATLDISAAELTDSGTYQVTVTNDLGMVTSREIRVNVILPPGGIVDGFDLNTGINGQINDIERTPDGKYIVGGYFTTIRGQSQSHLARLNADGSLDTTFTPSLNNGVQDVEIAPHGKIYIGGDFTAVNSVTSPRVARLNPDGSMDTSFDVGTSGANSTVYGVEPLNNGQLIVVGRFTAFADDSTVGRYAVRLKSDGLLDTSFNLNANNYCWDAAEASSGKVYIAGAASTIAGSPFLARINSDGRRDESFSPTFNSSVYRIHIQPDGKIIAAGIFSTVNGAAITGGLIRLNADGTADGAFQAVGQAGAIWAIEQQTDGRLLFAGSFTTFNNGNHNRLVRVNHDGSPDPTFAIGTGLNTSTTYGLELAPDGKVWVGGNFSQYNGQTVSRLIILNGDPVLLAIVRDPADTNVDLDGTIMLSVEATGTTAISYQWHRDGNPVPGANAATLTIGNATRDHAGNYTVTISNQSGSQTSRAARVIVLAEPIILAQPTSVSVAEGSPVTYSVQALGAGELHYQWRRNGTPLGDETNASLTVTTTLAASGCFDVVITNALGTITSLPAALGVYKAAGAIDGSFAIGDGVNNTVFATAALPNGNLAVGGFFTSVNGVSRNKFAVVDPQGQVVNLTNNYTPPQTVLSLAAQPDGKIILGHNTGNIRLNADGTVDNTFNSPGGWTPAVAVHGGHFYLGGYFGTFDKSLLRYDINTGARDEAFYNNITQTPVANVTAIAFQTDGKILAGENPGTLRRYNPDGTVDNAFAVSGVTITAVQSLAITADAKIWVGQGSQLYRLNSDGSLDTQITQISGTVRSLIARGNDVFAAGDFNVSLNSVSHRTFIRIRGSDGMVEESFGPVFSAGGSGYSISDVGNGKMVVGGQFTTPVARLARVVVESDATLAITCPPMGVTLDAGQPLRLTVGWTGASPATFQWTANDQNIPGATNQTLTIPMIGGTNAGTYKVVVTDITGSVTSAAANVIVNGAGQSFANWAASNNLPAGQDGPADDADNDGVPNFVEFALGTSPTSAASKALPADRTVTVNNVKYPGVAVIRRQGVTGADVEVKAFGSIPFNTEITTVQEGPAEDLGDGTERVIIRASQPLDAAAVVFFHTRVRQN